MKYTIEQIRAGISRDPLDLSPGYAHLCGIIDELCSELEYHQSIIAELVAMLEQFSVIAHNRANELEGWVWEPDRPEQQYWQETDCALTALIKKAKGVE